MRSPACRSFALRNDLRRNYYSGISGGKYARLTSALATRSFFLDLSRGAVFRKRLLGHTAREKIERAISKEKYRDLAHLPVGSAVPARFFHRLLRRRPPRGGKRPFLGCPAEEVALLRGPCADGPFVPVRASAENDAQIERSAI